MRNLDSRPHYSFWLQTSTDRFYPDFVCELVDGRHLVVEYKGFDRWSDDDSREKRNIGNVWEEKKRWAMFVCHAEGTGLECDTGKTRLENSALLGKGLLFLA